MLQLYNLVRERERYSGREPLVGKERREKNNKRSGKGLKKD